MDKVFEQERRDRIFSGSTELCAATLEIAGQKLTPDEYKGYCEFNIAQGLQCAPSGGDSKDQKLIGVNCYQTCIHPAVVANSFQGMLHQVVNRGHEMKANEKDPEKRRNAEDRIVGAVVGVEYPRGPYTLKPVSGAKNPIVRGAASIFKRAAGVDKLVGEHQTGKHRWTVSMEVNYSVLNSGFIIGARGQAKKKQEELMAALTPDEFSGTGYGYVPVTEAPDELLDCYNLEKSMVDKQWGGLPVALMKGGMDGKVGFMGVGVVRYGAEREAQIAQLLASRPDAFEILVEEGLAAFLAAQNTFKNKLKKVIDTLGE